MQYCSLQCQTLLLSLVTSTAGCCFCFGSISSFFLELFLHWSPVAYWAPTGRGSSSFHVLYFAFSYCSWGHKGLDTTEWLYWTGLNIYSLPGQKCCCSPNVCILSHESGWEWVGAAGGKSEEKFPEMRPSELGISELRWPGMGEFNSDDHYIYYCGQESFRRNGVAIIVNKRVWNGVLGWRMISVSKATIQYQSNPSLCPDQ